jgi:hypothetical protein
MYDDKSLKGEQCGERMVLRSVDIKQANIVKRVPYCQGIPASSACDWTRRTSVVESSCKYVGRYLRTSYLQGQSAF